MGFLRLLRTREKTCDFVWPPNASFYASSTCCYLRLLASPFDQGLTGINTFFNNTLLFLNIFCYRHSLLATHLLVKVNSKFGINLTVQDLFTCPTVAQMSKMIDELQKDGTQSSKLVK